MLKDLLEVWREKSLLGKMYDEFTQMLADARWMFKESCEAVFQEEGITGMRSSLFKRDININKTERRIRKQIVEHFAIRPGMDVTACLILMSVVKDAERLGDYCKNIYDTREIMGGPLPKDEFYDRLYAAHAQILETFNKVAAAFSQADEKTGYEIIQKEVEMGKEFDGMIKDIADSSLATRHAVVVTLVTRHFKRIDAHLGNIASTVVMPLHKIDYFDEKWK
jgi:phosphate uptake regulator